jgi:excisionase family DNA binding protein
MATKTNLDKSVFTTFEVARVCNANITSIKNWIEKGNLRAFRTPGGHYRIEKSVLVDFLDRYGMPNPFIERDQRTVVVLCQDPGTVELVRRAIGRNHVVHGTDDAIEAALLIGDARPDCLVMDMQLPNIDHLKMVQRIREHDHFSRTWIVGWRGLADEQLEEAAANAGVNNYVLESDGIDALTSRVREGIV